MRQHAARLALALSLLAAGPTLAQQAGRADPPRVLKGSAAAPGTAAAAPTSRGFEIAAGEDLWLIDDTTGDLVACRLLNTSTVGQRVIRCYANDLPARFRN